MRKLLLRILIVVCVIVGLGALSQFFHSEEDPSGSAPKEQVTGIELSDDELLL